MSDRSSDKRVTSTQESLQPQRIGKEEKAYQSVLDIEERLQKGDATNIALDRTVWLRKKFYSNNIKR